MINAVISNAYSYANKGDGAIVSATITELKRVRPDIVITVVSEDPRMDTGRYGPDIVVVPALIPTNLRGHLRRLFYFSWRLLSVLIFVLLYRLFPRYALRLGQNNPTYYAFLTADVVIGCGGGYLNQKGWGSFISYTNKLAGLWIPKLLHKRVILFPNSIGGFANKLAEVMCARVLRRLDMLCIRENRSSGWITQFRIDPNKVRMVPDIVFVLRIPPRYEVENLLAKMAILGRTGGPLVGVTVRDWHFPGHPRPDEAREAYLWSIAHVIDHLQTKHKGTVLLVPQVVVGSHDNDLVFSREVLSKCSVRKRLFLANIDMTPEELKGIYGAMDLVIGTRMHSNILALGAGIPCIAIAYLEKTWGVMEDLGLSDWVIDIAQCEVNMLQEKVDLALSCRDKYVRHIQNAVAAAELEIRAFIREAIV